MCEQCYNCGKIKKCNFDEICPKEKIKLIGKICMECFKIKNRKNMNMQHN